MRGRLVGRRRTNSFRYRYSRLLPSKSYPAFIKRSCDKVAVLKTAEEIARFYRNLFESLGIPFPTLQFLHSYKIPKMGGRNPRIFQMRSILHPESSEPLMRFETRREFPRRRTEGFPETRDGPCTDFRPVRLPPPLPEPSEGPWEDSWEGSPVVELEANPFVPTTPCNPVKEAKTSKQKEVKRGDRRYKTHSDKNHELSEDEDEDEEDAWWATFWVLSPASSPGKSTPLEDSEQCDGGFRSSQEVIPNLDPSGEHDLDLETTNSTQHDHNYNSAFQASGRKEVPQKCPDASRQLDLNSPSLSPETDEPVREHPMTGSANFSLVMGKFEMLSVTSGTGIQSLPGKHNEDYSDVDDDDDQDILIIGLTQEQMEEFK